VKNTVWTAFSLGLLALVLALLAPAHRARAATSIYIRDVPDYNWVYACMGTASGNLMGYWDRHGFPGFYTGTVNGGVAPLNANGANGAVSALWASKAGVDGRPAGKPGHVDDYYTTYEDTGPDPYTTAGRAEHAPDCVGDFIGMDQFRWPNLRNECRGNIDGFCFVSWDPSGERRVNHRPDPAAAEPEVDVQTGLRAWARWRGYDADVFTQLTDFNPDTPPAKGFTFADLRSEIDSGYPVLLFLQPYGQLARTIGSAENVNPEIHAMLAYGYYISSGINYVRYRTSWASGDNCLKAWTAQNWEAGMPVRGVIGFHPLPRIRLCSLAQGDLTLGWDGPASDVYDATLRTTNRVHGYVVEMSATCSPSDFQPVSAVILTNRFTIANCPSPAFIRLKLVRPTGP
jgi:hypothetical protein